MMIVQSNSPSLQSDFVSKIEIFERKNFRLDEIPVGVGLEEERLERLARLAELTSFLSTFASEDDFRAKV